MQDADAVSAWKERQKSLSSWNRSPVKKNKTKNETTIFPPFLHHNNSIGNELISTFYNQPTLSFIFLR